MTSTEPPKPEFAPKDYWHDPTRVIRMRAFDKDGNVLSYDLKNVKRYEIFDFSSKTILQELVLP